MSIRGLQVAEHGLDSTLGAPDGDQTRTLAGEQRNHCSPEIAGSTGDDHDLVCQHRQTSYRAPCEL